MVLRTNHIVFPNSNAKMRSLTRTFNGGGYGGGVGAVLLDGGLGGQSSYHSIDDYYETVRQPVQSRSRGRGLDDKIASKLRNLNIAPPSSKPKMKNITLSI